MTIFDLDKKSITIEFHSEDRIERKMLGIWASERMKQAKITMRLAGENVSIFIGSRQITDIPYALFDKLSVIELVDIIIEQARG